MNEGECLCLRDISINVNKLFTLLLFVYFVYVVVDCVFCLRCCCLCILFTLLLFVYFVYVVVVCVFCLRLSLQSCCCLLICLSLFGVLLLYFCLFVDQVNKCIVFVFGAFVYHFNNTISIIVTVLFLIYE